MSDPYRRPGHPAPRPGPGPARRPVPPAAPTGPNPVVRPEDAREARRKAEGGREGARKGTPGKPGGGGPQARARRKKQSRLFFGAAAALVALAVVALALVVVLWPGDDGGGADDGAVQLGQPELTGFAPGTYSFSPSTDVFTEIASRAEDPEPLTAEEMFPKGSLTDETADAKIVRRAAVLDEDCADAVWGTGLTDALGKAGCSQAVRGLYTDPKKGFAALVAVYNLKDSDAADAVVRAFGAGRAGFVRVPDAAPEFFGQGYSMARGIAMGHYAVVSWVQRFDGTGDEGSRPLLSLLVTAAEADALYTRAAG
ncbi:hypothetical protein LO762_16610 [Actinocorallia sp. API 0066]|uniref:hypothetical protein n=1 Tax=Actinocorallia sp. API 0066 TaxID=2896846 RepID=UPI001E564E63|nr:hypothetical protein [Actinocorallia sp. API 0066]MCD0450801.1 hypothetical protein [Actinocorallia sp. API 0066]